ncbi:EAL domain-containing protein [Curvibacter sp. APW13]|uniref:putative bifunctional diguanylate cyclase/phosphodiesterase n=1 Tax=Curvibacter sp. APW13 TaxID=3077236 RepID=UPI0028DE34DC|nr:EAL domain-containing protein [Curvibacter sp. APW13]MDT8992286.1 EAL domain-containing protein [Curvibacter sp. APW13]
MQTQPHIDQDAPPGNSVLLEAVKLALVYAAVASLWILFSDQAVAALFTDPQTMTTASMVKGWLFIAVTATLLFGHVHTILGKLQSALRQTRAHAQELQRSETQLRATLNALPDLLFEVAYDGTILAHHSNRHDLLAAPPDMFIGRRFSEILAPDATGVCQQALLEAAQDGSSSGKRYSLDLPQGEHWFELSVARMRQVPAADEDHYIMIARDVTLFHTQQRQLEHLEHFDPVTDLPNRLLLGDRLTQAMHHAVRRKQHVAVAYLDLDGFQAINERHGRGVGDQLLIALAKRFKQIMRNEDSLARIGGDEFALVFVDLDQTDEAQPILERFMRAVTEPVCIGDLRMEVTASAGLSFYPQAESIDADQLLRQADQAMYQAKLQGQGQVHLFDNARDHDIRGHNEFREHLRLALQRNEFVMYYQPKVDMAARRVIGMEALIRWQHPERGLLAPGAFLPEIEDDELAVTLGEWTLQSAFVQLAAWRSEGLRVPVSVNIGARQLQSPDFFAKFSELASRFSDVAPSLIELEILETSALQDLSLVSAVIQEFAALGVGFALDDFGTGYSSLSYFKRLQVPTIKIDQSFVRDLLRDAHDQAIMHAVLGLAKAFGRTVIAEGVETADHCERLLAMGCPLGQGYAIARPMPAHLVPQWVREYEDSLRH